ncbi:MAG: porin [Burkholderiaceae bacterium]|nr:porin [Rhodoferax sp.]MCP5284868.1 porin [Burkholderiaceae bacterium]
MTRTPRPLTRQATAAMLLLAGGAASAANFTLSGAFDIGVYRGFDEQKHVGTVQRSNLTLAGSEDLGSGLSATFRLQHRFEADTGAIENSGKPFWHGESSVGLKGSFGQVRLGRALDVVSNNDWAFDPWYNYDRIASPAWNNWHWNYATDRSSNGGNAEYGRLNNGIFYDSPKVAGWSLHYSGAFESAPGDSGNNNGLAVQYGANGIAAMAATSKNRSGDTVRFFGLSWSTGAWTLMGALDRSVYNDVVDSTAKVTSLGLRYAMGAANLKAGWAKRDVDGAKSNFLGLGADYALSKRTTVYASFGRQDPDAGNTRNAYGVGITHTF